MDLVLARPLQGMVQGMELLASSPAKALENAVHTCYTHAHAETAPVVLDLLFKPNPNSLQ